MLSLILISSCGLRYIPQETPQQFEERRHEAIKNYARSQFGKDSSNFSPLAFGELTVIKPDAYKSLDSLYALKYKNEEKHINDKHLEEQIELQRNFALSDTGKVSYLETLFFSYGSGDTIEFYTALFNVNHEAQIANMSIIESTYLPKRYASAYKIYLFEESFIDQGNWPTTEEQRFYNNFKAHASELSTSKREKFIIHTLDLMDLAGKTQTLGTENLLRALVQKKILGNSYSDKYLKEFKFEKIEEIIDNKSVISGYIVHFSYKDKTDENAVYSRYDLEYNPYLELVKETKL